MDCKSVIPCRVFLRYELSRAKTSERHFSFP